jgi:hypothetical protein
MAGEFFNDSATLVKSALWQLFNGLSSASLTLTGVAPTGPFRLAITLSASRTHVDCSGRVTINGTENIDFLVAGRKTSTTFLTSLPTITTQNLDCHILITCISTSGDNIYQTTNSTISVDWDDSQKWVPTPSGVWTQVDQTSCETDNISTSAVAATIGDTVLHNTKTFIIKNIKDGEQTLSGTVLSRIFQF